MKQRNLPAWSPVSVHWQPLLCWLVVSFSSVLTCFRRSPVMCIIQRKLSFFSSLKQTVTKSHICNFRAEILLDTDGGAGMGICVMVGGGNVFWPLCLLQELQRDVQKTKEDLLQNSTLLDRLPQLPEASAHVPLSKQLHSLQRASYLEKMLLMKANEFEVHLIFPFKS